MSRSVLDEVLAALAPRRLLVACDGSAALDERPASPEVELTAGRWRDGDPADGGDGRHGARLAHPDRAFDVALAEGLFSTLDRPMHGVYELLRVAEHAVVLVERLDTHGAALETLYTPGLYADRRREEGAYDYRMSLREIAKAAWSLYLPAIAFAPLPAEAGDPGTATGADRVLAVIARREDAVTALAAVPSLTVLRRPPNPFQGERPAADEAGAEAEPGPEAAATGEQSAEAASEEAREATHAALGSRPAAVDAAALEAVVRLLEADLRSRRPGMSVAGQIERLGRYLSTLRGDGGS